LACNESLNIDLHIHSDASDGTLSPAEILLMAHNLRLGAIAITDHDTIAGSKEAISAGIPPGLQFLTGIEISALPPPDYPCSGSFHILGYGIRTDDPVLNQNLELLQNARRDRNPRIIERLNRLGIQISLDELSETFGNGQLGRPHIARLMIQKGIVKSVDEAFDTYLSKGKPAYADKYRVQCARAIEIIRGAGGTAVLAHPVLLKPLNDKPLEYLIRLLRDMGLEGIEVYYPEHSQNHTARYREIADRYDLLMTGGTDFHGAIKPEIKMGSGRGDFCVPYLLYEKLIRK
jgi:predicted metal-dependent phosphoesterase TrpH